LSDITEAGILELRQKHYNATITERIDIHEGLARFRVRPDKGFLPFKAGQYVAIGLGNWESRLADCQVENLEEKKRLKMTRRAYSISCPLFDCPDGGTAAQMVTVNEVDYLELYIALVKFASSPTAKPPSLTPRLFQFGAGDRIEVQKKIVGTYILENIKPNDTVLMISTGTGEAPHNAMTTELLSSGHTGNIVNVTTVRTRLDLGYLKEHEMLKGRYPNYKYLSYTTREVENWDTSHPGYIGKQYVQELFTSGRLAEHAGDPLSPKNTHVFLCGNPSMIGYTPPGADPLSTLGMLQVLKQAGFVEIDDFKHGGDRNAGDREAVDCDGAGTIRFEKYW
jgi:ferredoxin--NADP+ reductase